MAYNNINTPAGGLKLVEMENQKTSIESLFERIKSYIDTRIEIIKLKAIDKSSAILSRVITYILVFVIFGFFFLLLNIAIACLIGELIGKIYYGFFILAAFYALAGIVLLKYRNKWIRTPLINMMVKGLHE